jgi:DNA-binding CsgD family transcriptional regulator
MTSAYPPPLDNLLTQSLKFAQGYMGASAALFFWVDPSRQVMQVQQVVGIPEPLLDIYERDMHRLDPMSVPQMVDSGQKVGFLGDGYSGPLASAMESYKRFLNSFGVTDTIDLMFWSRGRPFGGLGLLKTTNDPRDTPSLERVREFQRFLELSLDQHPHVARARSDIVLTERGLSHRERQVARLVAEGASNNDIAVAMGVTVGTVKTYLVRIFEKLDVKNRTALAALATNAGSGR